MGRDDPSGGSGRERDRLILAEIAGTTRRHMPLSGPLPRGEAAAIAEVRAAARGRADLLAEHAGVCLGVSLTHPVDRIAAQLAGQASLAARAGADMDQVGRWITVGFDRGQTVQASHQAAPRQLAPVRRDREAAVPGDGGHVTLE